MKSIIFTFAVSGAMWVKPLIYHFLHQQVPKRKTLIWSWHSRFPLCHCDQNREMQPALGRNLKSWWPTRSASSVHDELKVISGQEVKLWGDSNPLLVFRGPSQGPKQPHKIQKNTHMKHNQITDLNTWLIKTSKPCHHCLCKLCFRLGFRWYDGDFLLCHVLYQCGQLCVMLFISL